MINAISGYNPFTYGVYGSYASSRAAKDQGVNKAAQSTQSGAVTTARKVHQPESQRSRASRTGKA